MSNIQIRLLCPVTEEYTSLVYIHLKNKHINGLFLVIDIICPFLEGGSLKICESSWNTYFIMFLTLSALDYRLNPVLRKACKADIPKFCHGILTKAKEDSELEGQVISCLKLRYADQVNWPGLSTEVCSWSRLCSWH